MPPGVQQLTCVPATTEVSVCRPKMATESTLTASLYTWVVHVRGDTQEGSVTVTLMPVRVMVSHVIQELSALIFHHQPMPVGTNVDPVHQGILEMALSVWVSLQHWKGSLRKKEVRFPVRDEAASTMTIK